MEIKDFLLELENLNFSLSVKNGKLNLNANRDKVSKEEIDAVKNNSHIINYIRTHKEDLIKYISLLPKLPAGASKNIASIYRLSGLQEGMLFHSLIDVQKGDYVEQFICELVDVDLPALTGSWAEVIKRHTALRTAFYYDNFSIPVQCVYKDVTLPVFEIDHRELDTSIELKIFNDYLKADREKGFDFKAPPLIRLSLFRLNDNRYRMLWSAHHILFDGWSLSILMGELLSIYELIISNNVIPQAPEDKYEDYIRHLEKRDKALEEKYWRDSLKGVSEGTTLPFTKKVNDSGKVSNGSISKVLDKSFASEVRNYAKAKRITVNTVMQGVLAILLNRYTNSNDLLFGVVVSGRPEELTDVERRVGLFINTIPFRANFDHNLDIATWLQQLQDDQVASRYYQHTTLQDIKQWTGLKADLFDTLLVFENYPVNQLITQKKWSLQVENVSVYEQTNYPLTILIADAGDLTLTFNHNAEILPASDVTNIAEQFLYVLQQLAGGVIEKLHDVQLTTSADKLLLREFNNTKTDLKSDENLVKIFENQVFKTPDATAVIFEDESLSYTELNRRANQLARYLLSNGVVAETIVPLCIYRSIEMLVGILGILKAGGAYLPIDPEYPEERINYMLEDASANLVLSSRVVSNKLQFSGLKVVELDTHWHQIANQGDSDLDIFIQPDQLAYVIYTSGSSGTPKGVMNEHAGVVNRLEWAQNYFCLTNNDTLLQKTTFCFDVSVWELLWPILNGAKLVFAQRAAQSDSTYLKSVINSHRVTLVHFVPSMLNIFLLDIDLGDCESIKNVLCSGEALTIAQLNLFREKLPNATLHNLYGPTEAAIDVTYWSDGEKKAINAVPIGKPVWNTSIYITNKVGGLNPVGVPGEICIGGIQVARGYLNKSELTAEKFTINKYSDEENARLYRTGDLGCWLPDGNIEYLGRIDDQVKIRGYRIELGEIENVALNSGLVQQIVVLADNDVQANKQLIAYITNADKNKKQAVISYLQARLPEYMVPNLWVSVTIFPVTVNGKIDKRALLDSNKQRAVTDEYVAPRSETEQYLVALWQELLGVEQVSIYDNFFELGGHSLLAMRVVLRIRRELNNDVPIKELFNHPRIAEFSLLIANKTSPSLPVIFPQDRPEHIPLSYSQERLWFIDKLEGSIHYHLPAVLRLKGQLDIEALEISIKQCVDRHEVLRTVIKEHNGKGFQYIKPTGNWSLKKSDVRDFKNEYLLPQYINKLLTIPFDLSEDDMLRAELITLRSDSHILVMTMHHIASDGWSSPILVQELAACYSAITQNVSSPLKSLPIQYADYAIWQRANLTGSLLDTKLSYWKKKLDGISTLQLPTDHIRPVVQSTKGQVFKFAIPQQQSKLLNEFSLQQEATLYVTMLAAFNVLLFKYSGQCDICVGTPIANRNQPEVEHLIGFFVNTIALRNQVNEADVFSAHLQQVKQTMLEAYEHQEVPFEKVVEAVVKERDLSRTPLFQVMFVLQTSEQVSKLRLSDVEISLNEPTEFLSKYDINFNFQHTLEGIEGVIEYNVDLFEEPTIARMAGHYLQLIKAVLTSPNSTIGQLNMLSDSEVIQLQQFNTTNLVYPQNETIVSLFEKQVLNTPNYIAAAFDNALISYEELNTLSNQLARYLQSIGVSAETLVAIYIERGINMLVAMLGVLKAGGAYVPIDVEYPQERINFILSDTAAPIVITSKLNSKGLITVSQLIEIDGGQANQIAEQATGNLENKIKANQLAYVIYTSGSTGKPKGVMVEHGNITNYCNVFKNYFNISDKDVILQQSSISFDTICEEVYPALISGAKIIIVKEGGKDADAIISLIQNTGVSILSTTPLVIAYLNKNLENTNKLRYIISGGEILQPAFVDKLYLKVSIINTYGPSETTVCATYHPVAHPATASFLGKPISNTQIYIVNNFGELNAIGIPGEIHIGGAQVARGYLNNPSSTVDKFISDKFGTTTGGRLYKSGDVGRWLSDGTIEFIGRTDDQIKIRGYRIEPGEIETVLMQHEQVKQAVVKAQDGENGLKNLIGYLSVDGILHKNAIIAYLKSHLPDYMVPQIWVELDSFPLTPSGKINKLALPKVDLANLKSAQYAEPRNKLESELIAIWQDLLGIERIGINDNFFELGGHSLLVMRMRSQILKRINVVLSVRDLFLYPRIADLSDKVIRQNSIDPKPLIAVSDRPDYLPLSYSQERLWFIDKLGGSLQYHLPGVLNLQGSLDIIALEQAIRDVVNRHEILRTVIKEHDGAVYQHVKDKNGWQLRQHAMPDHQKSDQTLKTYINQLITTPFDLAKDDMLRGDIINLSDSLNILVLVIHHIAADAWSMPLLVSEVTTLYEAYHNKLSSPLSELPLQFADYALWQRNNLHEDEMDAKLKYWETKLNDVSAVQLPTDATRLATGNRTGATTLFTIDGKLSQALSIFSKQHEATLYMTLLSAFNVLLYNYSGQEDICVGTSIAGRPQQELEGLIGFFVNTLALRNVVEGEESFASLLSKVKQTTIEAYNNQEVPFEKVVEAVVKERITGVSPLFQVMLVLGNTPKAAKLELGDLVLSPYDHGYSETKFDLTFFLTELEGEMRCAVQYNADIFSKARIDGMISGFQSLLAAAVANPETPVGKLPMLNSTQQEQLLALGRSTCIYPNDATITEIFEAAACDHAEKNALIFKGTSISYKQLNTRSNKLANYLQRCGVKENSLVPLFADRGTDMIVGILGILKAGGAYVPIDTDYPQDRVDFIIEDTGATIVVSSSSVDRLTAISPLLQVVELDELDRALVDESESNPERPISSNNLAYVIYTSGSTGRPKGVKVTHQNIIDYVYGLNERINISSCKTFALVSTIATDLGNTVLYSSLFFGGALHLFAKETVSSIEQLHTYFDNHRIDCVKIVPSHWKALSPIEPLVPAKVIIFGGESLTGDVVRQIRGYSDCRIVNHYGPTETTVGKLLHEVIEPEDLIPIGRPFSNTSIYIFNKNMQFCPIGVPGQLFIGGKGVAKGYQRMDQLTAEKFIPDIFGLPGEMVYQTGDSVKYNTDGTVQFLGRVDDQIKIRGYRVEPAEISRMLETSEHVYRAVVVSRMDKQGNNQLIAYVVSAGAFNKDVLKQFLKEQLPDYMIPPYIVEIDQIPLTASGKIDRKALPDPEAVTAVAIHDLPETKTEKAMAVIWEDLLEIDNVGTHDDFFQLGGHSLLAVRLVSAIRKVFDIELPISDVFDYPTINQLSTRLQVDKSPGKIIGIRKQERPHYIPLSYSQERMWFIDKLQGSLQYHIPTIIKLKGTLNVSALNFAFRQIVNRHEVLRTVIREHDGQGYQVIKVADAWCLRQTSINEIKTAQLSLKQYLKLQIEQPFNLSEDDMLRAELIQTAAEENVLLLVMHHIASDGWSTSIIVKELASFYNSYLTKDEKVDIGINSALPLQYADFAIWQRTQLAGDLFEQKLSYWKKKLDGATVLQLPANRVRQATINSPGKTIAVYIDKVLTQKLNALSQNYGATLYMTLLSAFKVLLYRYSGQEDICVGTPVAGRNYQEIENLIGFFVNTLVLRSKVNGDSSFVDLLEQVKANTIEAYNNQDVPFEKVVETVVKEREMGISPLFQVMFALQNTPSVGELRLGDLKLNSEYVDETNSKFDVSLNLAETADGIHGGLEYNTDLYDQKIIAQMIGNFIVLLEAIVSLPDTKIGRINLLTEREANQQLKLFNSTDVFYRNDISIATAFEEQVHKTPHATAIIFQNDEITYNELNKRANKLARYLVSHGLTSETLIPICLDRGIDLIVAIIAVIKTGCAYVPLDIDSPKNRINYTLKDIGSNLLLSNRNTGIQISNENISIIDLDYCQAEIEKFDDSNLNLNINPRQLAYVIYTSGSTGQPKGVMIEHRGLVNLTSGQRVALQICEGTRVLQFASFGFDASCNEIFTTLLNGGCLITCSQESLLSPEEFNRLLDIESVEVAILPPAFQQFLTQKPPRLRTIVSAGETLNEASAKRIQNLDVQVVNGYGPTEGTVCATMTDTPILEDGTITIGKPIDNVKIYILNEQGQINPLGAAGEICISGIQVARGYLNQPVLSSEKFINNPFVKDPSVRMYRTGDIGRWLNDGNIEYLGRADNQVKIRGFRVELGEIENVLIQSGLVSQAVVVAKLDDENINHLVAYIVTTDEFRREELINYLTERLPDYMIPSLWKPVQYFALTSNGKIDKKQLPEVNISEQQAESYLAPRNELEKQMALVWENLLGVKKISVYDNFFELGGHSIMAMRLLAAIRKNLGVNVTVRDLFLNPTVAKLAKHIQRNEKENYQSLIPIRNYGNKTPLYIICGAGGTAFTFKQFTSFLDPDQPVYGLQQPLDIKSADEFPDTIEGIASRYVAEIRQQNPNGPYALSGHCLGGIIALEVANQLRIMGKQVVMLAMFDADAKPLSVEPTTKSMASVVKKAFSVIYLKLQFELFLLRKHPKQALMYKFKKMDSFLKSFEPKLVNIEQEIFDEVTLQIKRASEKYEMKPYDGEIIMFNAMQQYYFIDKVNKVIYKELSVSHAGKYAWADYAKSIKTHKVKGEHSTIFDAENAMEFSRILQDHLNESVEL